ncbi:uncharacterized protein UTRI_00129 [Ustilago trichophora]|uniref:Uncharacterized protein n=1 Tax=Ustilago trichophora TaxID=86804 RepID=A0A5C3DQH9_9BASI|nr:uncharacterized protein UTRI_00129 [Ustilago trichophora]
MSATPPPSNLPSDTSGATSLDPTTPRRKTKVKAPATPKTPRTPKTPKTPKVPKTTTIPKLEGNDRTEDDPRVVSITKTEEGPMTESAPQGENIFSTRTSPIPSSPRKLTPALQKTILALKMRGMSTKEVAVRINQNYKTVWAYINKTTKRKAEANADDAMKSEEMSDADKREAALVLKLAGCTTKDIAAQLDMNYKTLWAFFNQHQKAAGLPNVTRDPDL